MNLMASSAAVMKQPGAAEQPVIVLDKVSLAFDDKVVLREVSFTLMPGHTKVILGASGSGKSTILKLILGLWKPDGGQIWVNGQRTDNMTESQLMAVRSDIGMVFQEGALFDSLSVAGNVGYRLSEQRHMPPQDVRTRVDEILGFIGLRQYIDRMPSELSGGQRRRVAIARAMAAKPQIILYDEATTGLDPITATTVNHEIVKLRDFEGVASIIVTHQLRDAFFVATHEALRDDGAVRVVPADEQKSDEAEFIMLKDGFLEFEGNASELRASKDSYLKKFLS